MLAPHHGAEAQSNSDDRIDPAFARSIVAFYGAWLGRSLLDEERTAVFREVIAFRRKQGPAAESVRDRITAVTAITTQLREYAGAPVGLRLRHDVLATCFFHPDLQNTTELRLLNEPDPVRFSDAATRRILTERDVVALANLIVFAGSEGEPRHRKLSFQEAEALVRQRLGDLSRSGISEFASEAGILWTGIQQHWASFNDVERRNARAYVQRGRRNIMTAYQTSRLLGITEIAAFNRRMDAMADTFIGAAETQMKQQNVQRAMRGK